MHLFGQTDGSQLLNQATAYEAQANSLRSQAQALAAEAQAAAQVGQMDIASQKGNASRAYEAQANQAQETANNFRNQANQLNAQSGGSSGSSGSSGSGVTASDVGAGLTIASSFINPLATIGLNLFGPKKSAFQQGPVYIQQQAQPDNTLLIAGGIGVVVLILVLVLVMKK